MQTKHLTFAALLSCITTLSYAEYQIGDVGAVAFGLDASVLTTDNVTIGSSGNLADGSSRLSLSLRHPTAQFPKLPFSATAVDAFNGFGGQRSVY